MGASAQSRTFLADSSDTFARNRPLLVILGLGLVLRLVFLPASGFHNDLAAFEAWSLTLTEHPLRDFYRASSFADYPPGYFFVLIGVGWTFKALIAAHIVAADAYNVLGMIAKLPAIAMDLVDAWLVYRIAGRFAARNVALAAAALFALNPAAIYVSAYWGQVDSVSWGLVLASLLLLVESFDAGERTSGKVAVAWVLLAISLLMKPQAALVGLLFLVFPFAASGAERRRRLIGSGAGFAAGLAIAWLAAAIFHATLDPISDFRWLLERYTFGSGIYAYTSVNAFNLYAIRQPFWQPDSQTLSFFGVTVGTFAQWGAGLVIASALLFAGRYQQRKDARALLEAAMLISFAFFVLATRMHERYIYGAFLLMMPLAAFGRRYLVCALTVSLTLLVNLAYSLAYQTVMEAKTPGVDATNLWPLVTGPLSALNVAVFFYLGYVYLGGTLASQGESAIGDAWSGGLRRATVGVRAWFDPREGISVMTKRDWWFAGGFTLASFVLCILWYQWPAERYFDEVYYPRSAEEYIRWAGTGGDLGVFEWTHPPLSKLIIWVSMLLFGGVHGLGNTGFGWRFLNVVIGALTVGVIYIFAKYLLRSTLFASVAAGMLLFDGFHYVQSRIATPEITVAFFSLTTILAFYRLWVVSQSQRRPVPAPRYVLAFALTMAGGTVFAALIALAAANVGPSTAGHEFYGWTIAVAFVYVETAVYLFARLVLRRFFPAVAYDVSYADGTRLRFDADGSFRGTLPDGVVIDGTRGRDRDANSVLTTIADDGGTRTYRRDGSLTYVTPAGDADYRPDGSFEVAGVRVDSHAARNWLIVLTISGGLLAATKWNGLFDFFVAWLIIAAVMLQRFLPRPATFGNPDGIKLDIAVGAMVVVGGAIYIASYIPHFLMGHNLVDVVSLQHEMYWYHANLKATHPYASKWWQWPILQKPISYYYTDFRAGAARANASACCVAEILALPNPLVWWSGLLSVPAIAVLAVIERKKGYALLVIAYFLQWLPWIGSPRIAFEYHFYPNLSIIVLANAIILQRVWQWRTNEPGPVTLPRLGVGAYLVAVVGLFFFFYPVLAGTHVSWDTWHARMWLNSWII